MSWENKLGDYNKKKAEEEDAARIKHLQEVGAFFEQNGIKLLDLLKQVKARESLMQIRDEIWKLGSVYPLEFYGISGLIANFIRPFEGGWDKWKGRAMKLEDHKNIAICGEFSLPYDAYEKDIPFLGVMASVKLIASWNVYHESYTRFIRDDIIEEPAGVGEQSECLRIDAYFPGKKKLLSEQPILRFYSSMGYHPVQYILPDKRDLSAVLEEILIKDIEGRKNTLSDPKLPYNLAKSVDESKIPQSFR